MNLRTKLIVFSLAIGLLPLTLMGVLSVQVASRSLTTQASSQLTSLRETKSSALENLFVRWKRETEIYAATKEVYNALGMMRDAALGLGKKDERVKIEDSDFLGTVDWIAPAFVPFVEKLGFEDVYLIGDDGDYGRIYYTYSRGEDWGWGLSDGPVYKDSILAKAWKLAVEHQSVVFTDIAPYPGPNDPPVAFMVAPIISHIGEVDGVAACKLPLAWINELMNLKAGLGETGETYLVGQDKRMRSDSLRDPEHHTIESSFANPAKGLVETDMVEKALAGTASTEVNTDFRGHEVLSSFAPFSPSTIVSGDDEHAPIVTWALIGEIDTHEAFAPLRTLRYSALAIGLLTAILVFGVAIYFIRRELITPLRAIEDFLIKVSEGDLSVELTGRFKAEMGNLARGIREMFAEVKSKLGFSQGVLSGINFPCLVLDTEGRITYANQNILDMMEKTGRPEEYYGQTAGLFFTGDVAAKTTSIRALEEKIRIQDERSLRTATGKELTVSLSATPVKDLDGEEIGVFTLYYDLTTIREQERKITEQNAKINLVAMEASQISDHVSMTAQSLSDQVEQANEGARAQSESTSETAISMQEMNAAMSDMANNATLAAENADNAKRKALEGQEIVSQAISAISQVEGKARELSSIMDELGGQAHEVGKIMVVIEDIADQTNLLALNAAIEAARAGEYGRGFSVVADEVRKLAEKTMTATKEVGAAIGSIRKAADQSVGATHEAVESIHTTNELAKESGQSLSEIVSFVETTAEQVQYIAAGSEEQSAANERLKHAVDDISRISEETAEGMQQASQAIGDLAQTAQELRALIQNMRE